MRESCICGYFLKRERRDSNLSGINCIFANEKNNQLNP